MIQFAGERRFAKPLAEVFEKLTDAAFLVGCLSDAEVQETGPDRTIWKLKPKISFITGSLHAIMDITAREHLQSASYRIETKTIGASSVVTSILQFAEVDCGTSIRWSSELVQITGLLKMVPKGLLQGTAEKVIEEAWTVIGEKLA